MSTHASNSCGLCFRFRLLCYRAGRSSTNRTRRRIVEVERGLPAAQVIRPSEQDRPLRIHNNYRGTVLAFDANAKQPINTFRYRRHTLETIKRRLYIQVFFEHSSIGYDPTPPIGGSQGRRSRHYPKTSHVLATYGGRSNSLWLTSGFKLGPRLSK